MDRREFLAAFAATAAAGAAAAQPPSAQRPNVLFVLADQWRFSAFSHETDPLVKTPTMDKLAADGARFTRMHAANPVCTPNRSCILTGRYSPSARHARQQPDAAAQGAVRGRGVPRRRVRDALHR